MTTPVLVRRSQEPALSSPQPVFVPVFCTNADCPEFVRRGRRFLIGELTPGSCGRFKCQKCKRRHEYRVPLT